MYPSGMTADTSTAGESPVDRAFHVLQTVVAAGEPLGVRELSRRTGLPRSTTSRLVVTLERLRMVGRTADGEVIAGGGLATLQLDAAAAPMLADQLQPMLVDLVQAFGENAALAVDDGDALLYVADVASENSVSVRDVGGERHQFHLVAPGIVTMAHWDQCRLDTYLAGPLLRATGHSVTEPAELRSRCCRVVDDGFVWTDQELEAEVNGLAVPVWSDGDVVATISLYGPSYRFSPQSRPELATAFMQMVTDRLPSGR